MEISKSKKEVEKEEYKGFIIDRSRYRPEIDTQIGRIAGEFQKNENAEESHELEREGYQNSGTWGATLLGVRIWIAPPPIPHGLGGDGKYEEERPPKKRKDRGIRRGKSKSLEVELGLSGGISHGKYAKIRFRGGKGSAYCIGWEFQTSRRFGNVWPITRL